MKIKISKKLIVLASILVIMPAVLAALPALAEPNLGLNYTNNLGLTQNVQDPREMAVNIVKYLMTFLGIIAVVIILLGGFKWMTAAGNDDKIAEAKKLIIAGLIGLIIILAAYVIVNFVINATTQALNGSNITGQ